MQLPLLITVSPKVGESLNSIIARASCENAVERPRVLLNLVGLSTLRPDYIAFTKLEYSEALAQLLSIDSTSFRTFFHPFFDRDSAASLVDWFGTPLPRRYINPQVRRYSPSSLRKSGHHRAQWMIEPLRYCPESLELLSSDCPICGATLGWRKTLRVTVCEVMRAVLRRHTAERDSELHACRCIRNAALVSSRSRSQTAYSYYAPPSILRMGAG